MASSIKILLLAGVFLWYMLSIMVNVHWKSTFKSFGLSLRTTSHHYQYALFFTTVQFGAGAMASSVILMCSGSLKSIFALSSWWKIGVVIGSLFYLGQLSTNMSLTMTSVTITHMVKTLEPLLALLWALTILKNTISCSSIIYMQIMLAGVFLTTYTNASFSVSGVTFAIVSNVSLSLRNLFIKISKRNETLTGLQTFFVSCIFGFIYSGSLSFLFTVGISTEISYSFFSEESLKMGMYFSGQHIMSYLLLYYLSITSHALLNCLKRALIIFITAVILGIDLPAMQNSGIIITIIGSALYVYNLRELSENKPENNKAAYKSDSMREKHDLTFSKPHKCIIILPVVFVACLIMLSKPNSFQYNKDHGIFSENATAIWTFDAPLSMKTIELIDRKLLYVKNLKIFCSNVQKCKESLNTLNLKFLFVEIVQLKAYELSKDTPAVSWVASHPINKIKSLSCFPAYFQKMMYLSALWKYGNTIIDLALDVNDNANIVEFNNPRNNNHKEGCMPDHRGMSPLICNLKPKDEFTEYLMGEVMWMFKVNPKSCPFNSYHSKEFGYKIPVSEKKFGLIGYGDTHNLGDEMQSIGGAHILPHIEKIINRDTFTNPDHSKLTYIGNAWWPEEGILFKDIPNLVPVPVAVHITPEAYPNISSYSSLLKAMAPIGARDLKTAEFFNKNSIESLFTGCITLWMKNPNKFTNSERTNQTIIVDLRWNHKLIPIDPSNIKYISHGYNEKHNQHINNYTHEEKFLVAYEYFMQYSQAKLVVTSKIHVALPCVAMGTPVIFVNSKGIWDNNNEEPSPRVTGLLDMFHTVDLFTMSENDAIDFFKNFNWENPPPNPNPTKVKLLKNRAKKILEQIPELAISLKVFELIQ